MKYRLGIVLILAAYFAFSIATTKKDNLLPACLVQANLEPYLVNTGERKLNSINYYPDTLLLTYSDTTAIGITEITDSICRMGLQRCGLRELTILVRDTVFDPAQANSPYGKLLLKKECR
jgi:hypothetical protein